MPAKGKTARFNGEEVMKKQNKENNTGLQDEKKAAKDEKTKDIKNKEQKKKKPATHKKQEQSARVAKLEADLAESKDKYLRLYSEFDNFRRRTAKEKLELMETAGERIMLSLLPVLDDFKRAEKSLDSKDAKAIAEGVKLVADKFVKTLETEGLKLMDTEPGTEFDSELHEAVTQIPAPAKKLKGKIVDTIEQGYFLGEKVIRHAKVVIGA